jgi:hypothetical protein
MGRGFARQDPFSDSCPTAASLMITSLKVSPGPRSRAASPLHQVPRRLGQVAEATAVIGRALVVSAHVT